MSGSDWIAKQRPEVSEFGKRVADLLDDLYQGIYHIHGEVLNKRVDWSSDRWIEIVVYGSLSTFDFDELTRLVLYCHRDCIRCELRGTGPGYIKLCFSPRIRDGRMYERHPDIYAAIARITPSEIKEVPNV